MNVSSLPTPSLSYNFFRAGAYFTVRATPQYKPSHRLLTNHHYDVFQYTSVFIIATFGIESDRSLFEAASTMNSGATTI
jgi:hypothetical protein